jgi:DNA-binding beta-propeller fold protein YncE
VHFPSSESIESAQAWLSLGASVKRVHRSRIRLVLPFVGCVLGTVGCGSGGYSGSLPPPLQPSLQSIQVSPANSSAPLGRTQQFTAMGMLSNGSSEDLTTTVTWSSSAPSVATVSGAGLASSKSQGSTTILATSGSVSGSTGWTVVAPALVSIAISPANASIPRGTTQQFSATGTFTDGSMRDITGSVGWVSSLPSVVSLSSTGLANGAATGRATIAAALGVVSGSTLMTVTLPLPRFAYVANLNDNTVSIYAVDSTSGQMHPNGYVLTGGSGPESVTVDPAGKFAYVANIGSNNVSAFTIDASTGSLMAVPGSPFIAGTGPESVTVDLTGHFAFVANFSSNNVSAFTINPSTGAFTAVSGSPFGVGTAPFSMIVTGKIQ